MDVLRSAAGETASGDAPGSGDCPETPVRAELPWRHPEPVSELLPEIVLRFESAATRDLGDAQIAPLQQLRSLVESLLFEKLAEESAGEPMETTRHVLTGVSELAGNGLDRNVLIRIQTPVYTLEKRTQQSIHGCPHFHKRSNGTWVGLCPAHSGICTRTVSTSFSPGVKRCIFDPSGKNCSPLQKYPFSF